MSSLQHVCQFATLVLAELLDGLAPNYTILGSQRMRLNGWRGPDVFSQQLLDGLLLNLAHSCFHVKMRYGAFDDPLTLHSSTVSAGRIGRKTIGCQSETAVHFHLNLSF